MDIFSETNGRLEVADYLIATSNNPDERDYHGFTLLMVVDGGSFQQLLGWHTDTRTQ